MTTLCLDCDREVCICNGDPSSSASGKDVGYEGEDARSEEGSRHSSDDEFLDHDHMSLDDNVLHHHQVNNKRAREEEPVINGEKRARVEPPAAPEEEADPPDDGIYYYYRSTPSLKAYVCANCNSQMLPSHAYFGWGHTVHACLPHDRLHKLSEFFKMIDACRTECQNLILEEQLRIKHCGVQVFPFGNI